MTTDTNFVGLELHNQLTAGPAPWTATRVPAQVFHVCRAVFGTTSLEDDQRVYRTLQAALMLQTPAAPSVVTSDMIGRFLSWRLPEGFSPDCFVSFDKERAKGNGSWPIGTNLLDAEQAKAMLQHVLGG
jgi:hypothetical protein